MDLQPATTQEKAARIKQSYEAHLRAKSHKDLLRLQCNFCVAANLSLKRGWRKHAFNRDSRKIERFQHAVAGLLIEKSETWPLIYSRTLMKEIRGLRYAYGDEKTKQEISSQIRDVAVRISREPN